MAYGCNIGGQEVLFCHKIRYDILGAVYMTQFFGLLWGLKYSEERKLKDIATLSNMKACHQAK